MKVTTKIIALLIILALASPAILFEGCGSDDFCGGCPTDSIAPYGSTITAPTLTAPGTIDPAVGDCIDSATFRVQDPGGNLMNGVCIEIFTNALVAEDIPTTPCTSRPITDYSTYIRTRTSSTGTISLDIGIYSPCSVLASGASSGSFWVSAVSCTAEDTASVTVTLSPACT